LYLGTNYKYLSPEDKLDIYIVNLNILSSMSFRKVKLWERVQQAVGIECLVKTFYHNTFSFQIDFKWKNITI